MLCRFVVPIVSKESRALKRRGGFPVMYRLCDIKRGTLSFSQQQLAFLYSSAGALELTCIEMFRKYFRRNENGKVVE